MSSSGRRTLAARGVRKNDRPVGVWAMVWTFKFPLLNNKHTTLIFAKTLAKKCNSPLRFRANGSLDGFTCAPSTNASTRSGRARTSCGSPEGYGTGAVQVPQRDWVGYNGCVDFGSVMIGIFSESKAEHAIDDVVRFESSIDARSASNASAFWKSSGLELVSCMELASRTIT